LRQSRCPVLDVIGAYRKQLQKAIAEYDKSRARRRAGCAVSASEQEFCGGHSRRDGRRGAARPLVKERVAALGIADAKQVGRLIGDIMKTHKGQVEAGDVKRIAEELLKG
jgi:hypothetical protein